MKSLFLSFCLIILCIAPGWSNTDYSNETKEIFKQLDKVIAQKELYQQSLEKKATAWKRQLQHASGYKRINICKRLVEDFYLHTQTDSANKYVDQIAHSIEAKTDTKLQNYVCMQRANIFATTGMHHEALETLSHCNRQAFNRNDLLAYYHLLRTIYGWMEDYTSNTFIAQKLRLIKVSYRDSILELEPKGLGRNIVMADKAIDEGNARLALEYCTPNLNGKSKDKAYSYYNLAEYYRLIGNKDKEAYYLAKTAIIDLESGVTEYIALPKLAELLFKNGNIERAYNYLLCSIEDANYCKARLRAIEATNIFPIIEKAYKEMNHRRRLTEYALFIGLSLLTLLLAYVIYSLRRQMRKNAETRRQLAETNQQLKKANEAVQETNKHLLLTDKVKEEYIARYLSRCHDYIDKLDLYRRDLLRVAKNGQKEDLLKLLKSETIVAEEQKNFYADFDNAFLTLFPHFIENFNNLLEPEARIVPKKNEQLNTELRIFALIRLGVTESTRIAHFLNYSLATIYNYRSKYRNKALCEKNEFEKRIEEL
jgi:regulatory protein susR